MVFLRIHEKIPLYEHVVYVISERDRHALVLVIRSQSKFTDEIIFYSAMSLVFILHMHAFRFSTTVFFFLLHMM